MARRYSYNVGAAMRNVLAQEFINETTGLMNADTIITETAKGLGRQMWHAVRMKNKLTYIKDGHVVNISAKQFADGITNGVERVYNETAEQYINLIFNKSQELVPIDKRFIGRIQNATAGQLGRRVDYAVMPKGWREQTVGRPLRQSHVDDSEYRREELRQKYLDVLYSGAETFYSGLYKQKHLQFINSFFKTPTNQWRKRLQLEFDAEGNIYRLGKPLGIKKRNIATVRKARGGHQELRKSGRILSDNLSISYSATDSDRNDNFNYAQLQHDELSFKHARGKQANYLRDSFMYYAKQFKAKLRENLKRGI